jgi:LmbE family N-acetylglucosaminyl deacetylase
MANNRDNVGGTVGIIVAHPDDETLWAGGLLLSHPTWRLQIATVCRGGDADRAPRFRQVLSTLHAQGEMADLDDGPAQEPLDDELLQQTIRALTRHQDSYDLLITHGPRGEYTRHLRHQEVHRAVLALWRAGDLRARQLWCFAYDDAAGQAYPQARADADLRLSLPPELWERKYQIIRAIYGFSAESWEAQTTPTTEAFWVISAPDDPRFGRNEDEP